MDSKRKKPILHKSFFPLKNRLALSTGDSKGVGFYITKQALTQLGPQKNFQFIVWSDWKAKTLKIPSFQTHTFKNSKEAFQSPFKDNLLIQIKAKGKAGDRLIDAGQKALEKKVSALITGPLSKTGLSKYKSVGQTDLLKKITDSKEVFMCFRGAFFNVILLNDHVPFHKTTLSKIKLKRLIKLALEARSFLPKKLQNKKLGVLGLNPHAGEQGLLGKEEENFLKPLIKKEPELEGPLSPDSAFLKKNWNKYSFFIALYHDQGLIPFKLTHGQKAFSQNLGLPFFRFGVSHGTALDLKKKDIAFDSFLMSLKEAIRSIQTNKTIV